MTVRCAAGSAWHLRCASLFHDILNNGWALWQDYPPYTCRSDGAMIDDQSCRIILSASPSM